MNRALRTLISSMVAAGITCGLFLTMVYLATSHGSATDPAPEFSSFSFERMDVESILHEHKPPPEELKPPEPTEPLPEAPVLTVTQTTAATDAFVTVAPGIPSPEVMLDGVENVKLGGLGTFGNGDGDLDTDAIPLTRFEPIYPRDPQLNGTEGYVLVEFTITRNGGVQDVSVVESEPARVFDRAARRAILKWKFEPRVVNGEPVARRASQRLVFQLEQ